MRQAIFMLPAMVSAPHTRSTFAILSVCMWVWVGGWVVAVEDIV